MNFTSGALIAAQSRMAKRMSRWFKRMAKFLKPYARKVTVLADRGFRDHDWAKLCQKVGWRYRIRVTKNTIVIFADGHKVRIDQLGVKKGQIKCFQHIRLTVGGQFPTHLTGKFQQSRLLLRVGLIIHQQHRFRGIGTLVGIA